SAHRPDPNHEEGSAAGPPRGRLIQLRCTKGIRAGGQWTDAASELFCPHCGRSERGYRELRRAVGDSPGETYPTEPAGAKYPVGRVSTRNGRSLARSASGLGDLDLSQPPGSP